MRRVWSIAWGAHNQLTAPVWCAKWTIPFGVLILAISVLFWQAVTIEVEQTVAQQVDYEDSTLCTKFGFAANSEKYDTCKLDLLDLRRSHERLVAAASFP